VVYVPDLTCYATKSNAQSHVSWCVQAVSKEELDSIQELVGLGTHIVSKSQVRVRVNLSSSPITPQTPTISPHKFYYLLHQILFTLSKTNTPHLLTLQSIKPISIYTAQYQLFMKYPPFFILSFIFYSSITITFHFTKNILFFITPYNLHNMLIMPFPSYDTSHLLISSNP
jgi:hypothetical protein